MFHLDYMFTEKDFKRIVKWCEEDPSNIWYDRMEQEALEFADLKNSHKQETQKVGVDTVESERVKNFKNMVNYYEKLPKEGT